MGDGVSSHPVNKRLEIDHMCQWGADSWAGYRIDLEYTDLSHTPRNIPISTFSQTAEVRPQDNTQEIAIKIYELLMLVWLNRRSA